MLEDCLFASRPSARSRKPLTLVLSVITHVVIACVLILIPLFQDQLLPQVPALSPLRPPTLAAQSVELVSASRPPSTSSATIPQPTSLFEPIAIPEGIRRLVDEPVSTNPGFLPSRGFGNGPSLPGLGDPFGVEQAAPPLAPPAKPPAPPAADPDPVPTAPVPRGGIVMQSSLLYSVTPEYPRLAVITKVQGAVLIEAVITREGTIDPARLRVISGHVLLVPAAVEAVKQWRYRPTMLNGVPVEVLTTITVNFTLN